MLGTVHVCIFTWIKTTQQNSIYQSVKADLIYAQQEYNLSLSLRLVYLVCYLLIQYL